MDLDSCVESLRENQNRFLNLRHASLCRSRFSAVAERTQIASVELDYAVALELVPLCEAWEGNTSVEEAILNYNHIAPKGAELIAGVLERNHVLVFLSLSNNFIGDDGACYIGEALKINGTLSELVLSQNHIGPLGAYYLAEALKVNQNLNTLQLSRNTVQDEGMGYLAEMLRVNTGLIELSLNWNYFGDSGAIILASCLKENQTLCRIYLAMNSISSIGALEIYNKLEENRSLVFLLLRPSGLDINRSILQWLDDKVSRNMNEKQQNFVDVLNGDCEASWNRMRLMLVGKGRVGKTATVRSLLGQRFNPNCESTVGASVLEARSSSTKPSDNGWMQTDDDPAMDFSSHFAYRILLQRNTIKKSKKRPSRVISAIKSKTSKQLRTQNHKRDESQDSKEVQQIESSQSDEKKEITRPFLDQSLMDVANDRGEIALSIWDFGGQAVFYTMHHIFLSNAGIYLLVFDMREFLDKSKKDGAKYYATFWLKSIRLHAPLAPVILIGTFLNSDEVQHSRSNIFTIDEILKEIIGESFPQLLYNTEEELSYFPIDNRNAVENNNATSEEIVRIRRCLEEVARNDKTMAQSIPIRWMALLDELNRKRFNEDANYVQLREVRNMALDVGILNQKEQDRALALFHARGMIVHLTATETLKSTIIVNPQWLIDAFSKVIRDRRLHTVYTKEFELVGLDDDLVLAFKKGVASRDLLDYLWSGEPVEFLIDLMKRTMLLSDWGYSSEKSYLIPSLLESGFYREVTDGGHRCLFDFSNDFLPTGVFLRLVCLCVAHAAAFNRQSQSNNLDLSEPVLCQNFLSIELESGCQLYLEEDKRSQIIVMTLENKAYAARCLKIVQSMLLKLNADVMGTGLSWKTLLQKQINGVVSYIVEYEARQQALAPWYSQAEERNQTLQSQNVNLEAFLDNLF